jgi:hypothetical protein
MIKITSFYVNHFFYLTRKFKPFWSLYNISLIFWNPLWDFYSNVRYYKPAMWIFCFTTDLESTLIIYYLSSLAFKNLNYTNYDDKNFTIFFKAFFFKWYINNIFLNIFKKIAVFFKIVAYNIKWILIAFVISFIYFFFSLFYVQIEFTKQISVWFLFGIIYYLLVSTFNNFLNKYKYGKFTSAIQRFWKRTGITFWLIEGFLFSLFFYYFLNSSQESLYMFDYANLNQELLIQLKLSYKNMILLSFSIYFSFILILNNNFLNYYQNVILLSIISLIIFYMLYVETYQFVYIISLFSDKNWLFDKETQSWCLEFEQNILRTKQQYFIMCLIAKYWHFIFIFISWFFFVIKCFEINKINYTLMGYNIQNLIILYVLNLLCLVQWAKWVFKKFIELTYYWFHIQYDEKFILNIFEEIYNTILSLFYADISGTVYYYINAISNLFYSSNQLTVWKYINWIKKKNSKQ